jgi:O-acetyl-ADP-ribose deacetylase (regulator of RNase III)
MKIQLIDRNVWICHEWRTHFKGCHNVLIHQGDFFSLPTNCIVSSANSFGLMDGGLDAAIIEKVGIKTEQRLQRLIHEKYAGELLVGQAVLIETEYPDIPYLISAPTMRVPLLISGSVNIYLAAKAIFRVLLDNPQIETVTISGLGTGHGNVPEAICAQQMRRAYDETILGRLKKFENSKEAQREHFCLINLQ